MELPDDKYRYANDESIISETNTQISVGKCFVLLQTSHHH